MANNSSSIETCSVACHGHTKMGVFCVKIPPIYCTTVLLHNSLENLKKTPVFLHVFFKRRTPTPTKRSQWAIKSRNLVAQLSAQLSHLPLILSLCCICYIFLFKMMYHSLYLTQFQPSYLRSWYGVKDMMISISFFERRNDERTQVLFP